MKKKRMAIVSAVLVLTVVLVIMCMGMYDNSQKVQFADEEMGNLIAFQAYREGQIESVEDFRQKDLANVEYLNIGYTGYYTTLSDIELCTNLEELYIGAGDIGHRGRYYMNDREVPEPESEERITQVQSELEGILQNNANLNTLYSWNTEGTCELKNMDFLEYGNSLQVLWLDGQKAIDYSPILNCTNLISLSLYGCEVSDIGEISDLENLSYLCLNHTNVSEAGDMVNLPDLDRLNIKNTPLAENEEELALIYEAFPEIQIRK